MGCDADFEDELSAGLKAGILGLIAGGLLWLMMGEKKHGVKGYDTKPKPKPATTSTVSTTETK